MVRILVVWYSGWIYCSKLCLEDEEPESFSLQHLLEYSNRVDVRRSPSADAADKMSASWCALHTLHSIHNTVMPYRGWSGARGGDIYWVVRFFLCAPQWFPHAHLTDESFQVTEPFGRDRAGLRVCSKLQKREKRPLSLVHASHTW